VIAFAALEEEAAGAGVEMAPEATPACHSASV
jgi:hypothetical protein